MPWNVNGWEKKFRNFLPFFQDSLSFSILVMEIQQANSVYDHLVSFSQCYKISLEIGNENRKPDGEKTYPSVGYISEL